MLTRHKSKRAAGEKDPQAALRLGRCGKGYGRSSFLGSGDRKINRKTSIERRRHGRPLDRNGGIQGPGRRFAKVCHTASRIFRPRKGDTSRRRQTRDQIAMRRFLTAEWRDLIMANYE